MRLPVKPKRAIRTLFSLSAMGAVALSPIGALPNAAATPYFPDIDALIDDGDPPGSDTAGVVAASDLLFTTATGVICRKTLIGPGAPTVSCAGPLPKAPPGIVGVTVSGSRVVADGPARFLSTPPELFLSSEPPVLLPEGHKIVFRNYASQDSVVCGVPQEYADLVCVLKASTEKDASGPKVTHGFVIASTQSYVF